MSAETDAQARAAEQAVTEAWDAPRPETGDPDFWNKTADCEERLAHAYRALLPLVDDRFLRMALVDAAEYRQGQANGDRRRAAEETQTSEVAR